VGALVLFNSPNVPSFQRVSVPLVIGTSLASGGIFLVVLIFGVRAQKIPVRMGIEGLVGRTGLVRTDLDPEGTVQLGGELWTAQLVDGEDFLPSGTKVVVVSVRGVRLYVKRDA
jgi:membrane-bound serine protease (ClpP class)